MAGARRPRRRCRDSERKSCGACIPRVPLYLLGESMGGAVAVVAMTGESGTRPPDVDGVILAAPAVWGRSTMDLCPGWRCGPACA